MLSTESVSTTTEKFVREWFDLLSRHDQVELLLARLADDGLEMVFPERTLRSHADFRDWYAEVGTEFKDQDHILERLDSRLDGDQIRVQLTVRWKATRTSDGAKLDFHADQEWVISAADTDRLLILTYRVRGMRPA